MPQRTSDKAPAEPPETQKLPRESLRSAPVHRPSRPPAPRGAPGSRPSQILQTATDGARFSPPPGEHLAPLRPRSPRRCKTSLKPHYPKLFSPRTRSTKPPPPPDPGGRRTYWAAPTAADPEKNHVRWREARAGFAHNIPRRTLKPKRIMSATPQTTSKTIGRPENASADLRKDARFFCTPH